MAAKHGGVNKLNIKYAKAAAFVRRMCHGWLRHMAGHRTDQLQVRRAGYLVRAPLGKIAFLENITGPSHRPRELLLDFIQPQPPPFVSALLYHIQTDPPDIVYSDLVEGPLDE